MPDTWPRRATTVAVIAFLAYFHMSFYMDISNDSETFRYGETLANAVTTGTIATDESGRYTVLTEYVVGPVVHLIGRAGSGAGALRGYTVVRFLQGLALFVSAYAFYKLIGLEWLTRLAGLTLLSISVTFSTLAPGRGLELDKVFEAMFYLLASIALILGRQGWLVPISGLAALNRETAVLMPLLYLAAEAHDREALIRTLRSWRFILVLALSLGIAGALTVLSSGAALDATVFWRNLSPEALAYANGGFALLPLLALLWVRTAPSLLRRLFWTLTPGWILLGIFTEPVRYGAYLLAPTALLFIPITLLGVEAGTRRVHVPAAGG